MFWDDFVTKSIFENPFLILKFKSSLVIDYNEMIIISKNGDYNDYNKRKW